MPWRAFEARGIFRGSDRYLGSDQSFTQASYYVCFLQKLSGLGKKDSGRRKKDENVEWKFLLLKRRMDNPPNALQFRQSVDRVLKMHVKVPLDRATLHAGDIR